MDPGVQKYIATREDREEHKGGKTFGDVMHKIFQEPRSTATRYFFKIKAVEELSTI